MTELDIDTKTTLRRTSKQEWFNLALNALSTKGIAGVKVGSLARSLGISRAGFYWHFKNREDLLHQLLNYWALEQTEKITENPGLLALEPTARLIEAAEMITKNHLGRYDIAIWQWALTNEETNRMVSKVNGIRLNFARDAFRELNFTGDDLEMRAMLYVCYQASEVSMFHEIPRSRLRDLIAKRIELLTKC